MPYSVCGCSASECDAAQDLELMLQPVVRLPQVELLLARPQHCVCANREPVEVQITLELGPREPALDFARQLLGMVHQLSISSGIVFTPACLQFARRLIRHAEVVSSAWAEAEVDSRRKQHHRRE